METARGGDATSPPSLICLFGGFVTHAEEWLLALALAAMTALYTLSILSRYITKISMPWADEAVMFLFIWATFLGMSVGVKRGAHLGVAVIFNALPPKARRWMLFVIVLCCVFTCLVLGWEGMQMALLQYRHGQKSSQAGIPMVLVGLAIPVGLFLSLVRFIQILLEDFRKGEP